MSQEAISVDTAMVPVSPAPVQLGTLQATSPSALVQGASEMARALGQIIQSQHLALTIQGRQYVRVEGWTTLGVMLGVVAREVSTVEQDGVYTATVELVRISDQAVISRASAECGSADELDKNGKPVWASRPRYARRSMAQTRATGKACRLAFSWIMKLAGYEPTPAEEIPTEEPEAHQQPPTSEKPIGNQSREHRQIEARLRELYLDRERVKDWCRRKWGTGHFSELTTNQYRELLTRLPGFAKRMEDEEASAEREAIQTEAQQAQQSEPLPADQQKAKALLEQARQIRQQAQYADGPTHYQDLERAQAIEAQARAILNGGQ